MLTIGIICLFALVTCNDYEEDGIEYDEYVEQYDDSGSGSGSGDDVVTFTTTTTPAPSTKKDVGDSGGAVVGGILGGLGILAVLAILGRRFCRKSRHEKEKDDKELDYDYYGIINRRTSSYV
jgi:hypothetical protein